MPDHLHLLVVLGENHALSEVIRLFKGRLSPPLRRAGLHWQEGYYDHRMRDNDDRLPVFLYIFLNPYRANLISADAVWPGYYCDSLDWEWFDAMTDSDLPSPEWLR